MKLKFERLTSIPHQTMAQGVNIMNAYKAMLFLVILLILPACGPSRVAITMPPSSIHIQGVDFMPLNEPGWYLLFPKDQLRIQLAKYGESPNETEAIQVLPERIPSFSNDASFYDMALSYFSTSKQRDTDRFKIIERHADKFLNDKAICIKHMEKSYDTKAVNREKTEDTMILEISGYLCRHPKNNNIAYHIVHSRRYQSHSSDSTANKTKDIFGNFEFTDF